MDRVEDTQFSICTLNIWGLPWILAKDKITRVRAIGNAFKNGHYDVLVFQEVWCGEDLDLLSSVLSAMYPYHHYFYSGVIGSGLCAFSKWPIEDVFFHQWSINGYFHMVHHGDWYGGKGIGLVRLIVGDLKINVYTAHLHANYNKINDKYKAHRLIQAFNSAAFIERTSGDAHLSILAGDLNTTPDDLCYEILIRKANLLDTFDFKKGSVSDFEGTCGTSQNSYSTLQDPGYPKGERIDHILFTNAPKISVEVTHYDQPLRHGIPNTTLSYSDHEAVSATFKITRNNDAQAPPMDLDQFRESLNHALDVCHHESKVLKLNSKHHWQLFLFFIVTLILVPIITHFPHSYQKTYGVACAVVSVLSTFSLVMSLLWYKTEYHTVFATKCEIEIAQAKCETKNKNGCSTKPPSEG